MIERHGVSELPILVSTIFVPSCVDYSITFHHIPSITVLHLIWYSIIFHHSHLDASQLFFLVFGGNPHIWWWGSRHCLFCRSEKNMAWLFGLVKAPVRIWGFREWGYLSIIKVMNDHFSIQTHGDLGIFHVKKPPNVSNYVKCQSMAQTLCQDICCWKICQHVRWESHEVYVDISLLPQLQPDKAQL